MKHLVAFALAAGLLAACRPAGLAATTATPTPSSPEIAAGCESCTPAPAQPWIGRRLILQSASLSLAVDDPVRVLAQIEAAVAEMGGVVVSSSTWASPGSPTSASLSARLPPEALIKLRRVATGLAIQVQSDNVYSQDATQDYLRLRQRLEELTRAGTDIEEIITGGAGRQAARSLLIAWQMVAQERANIESQIADYDGRAGLASFDLSLNGPGPMLMIE